jgi:aspartyl/glutamyl-tRNA(Asn/Gln) amidotransferase C subunit
MPAPLSEAEVERCAELAGVRLSPTEIASMRGELGRILAYADELAQATPQGHTASIAVQAAQTGGALAPLQPSSLRPDQVESGTLLDRETVLSQAPARERDYFVVPAVLPESESEREPEKKG